MNKTLIIYHSVTGTTRALAQAIARGASRTSRSSVFEVTGSEIVNGRFKSAEVVDLLDDSDGVIFGSPTFMGGPSAQFKAFADFTSEFWDQQRWKDKFSGGFTIGTSMSGDQFSTIDYFRTFSAQHGMLWVSIDIPGTSVTNPINRLGCQSGLVAHSPDGNIHEQDLALAEYLGERVGKFAGLSKELIRISKG